MKNRLQILKQIEKNQTYESIRFNNKQISDEHIKITIDEFFPKIFSQEKWKQITFFIKTMKDEEFYKKLRTLVGVHLSLQMHLEQIQQRQIQKCKIQDSNQHGGEQFNRKKMTRAALAKRNQQTQQQLRKDQIYVRLTPKTQYCLQWMLCNRNFPRIQCKLSCNQHIEYLINYLSNKWLRGKGHNRIVLYPDGGSYLKSSLQAKQREKILKQPLNNYFMFTDVMVGSGISQNGVLNLQYDILEKKKDGTIRPTNALNNSNNQAIQSQKRNQNAKKKDHMMDLQKKVINLQEIEQQSKKQQSLQKSIQKGQKYVPVSGNYNIKQSNQPGEQQCSVNGNRNIFIQKNTQSLLLPHQNQAHNSHSNNFLSNQSNLLNPNKALFHDQESIFKSIGFFSIGGGNNNNSIGFATKRNDYNLLSINSNSYLDIEGMNEPKNIYHQNHAQNYQTDNRRFKEMKYQENKGNQSLGLKSPSSNNNNGGDNAYNAQNLLNNRDKDKISDIKIKNERNQKISNFNSPKKQSNSNKISQRQKQQSKSNQKSKGLAEISPAKVEEEQHHEIKKHHQKLIDLRKAINFVEEAEGFHDNREKYEKGGNNEQVSQKSGLKQIKTVSIKKKTVN